MPYGCMGLAFRRLATGSHRTPHNCNLGSPSLTQNVLRCSNVPPPRSACRQSFTCFEEGCHHSLTCLPVVRCAACRMVRLIAAGLVEVGHGRVSPQQFRRQLEAGSRAALQVEAAPPHGLYLQKVGR
eukprot:GHRQ01027058.1.p2 GENE.GHRQ01027058.1~~GHRQ01027058.1.p2  ORF type:complete len:127 (-),score=27.62 GHRQ01027058.1:507-887(-)